MYGGGERVLPITLNVFVRQGSASSTASLASMHSSRNALASKRLFAPVFSGMPRERRVSLLKVLFISAAVGCWPARRRASPRSIRNSKSRVSRTNSLASPIAAPETCCGLAHPQSRQARNRVLGGVLVFCPREGNTFVNTLADLPVPIHFG